MITIIMLFCGLVSSYELESGIGFLVFILFFAILSDIGLIAIIKNSEKQQTVTTRRRRTTRRTTPKTTYSTTRVTKVSTPKTHGITTTSTTQKRCPNCGCYVHVSANGAYECGYCANYYGGNK